MLIASWFCRSWVLSILSEDVESLKTVDKKYDAALGLAITSIVLPVFVAEMIVNKDLFLHFRFGKLSQVKVWSFHRNLYFLLLGHCNIFEGNTKLRLRMLSKLFPMSQCNRKYFVMYKWIFVLSYRSKIIIHLRLWFVKHWVSSV